MLYRQLACYYDYVYAWKAYKKEAREIRRLISKYKKSLGNDLLEVGCGTGNYLRCLSKDFSCTGLDISKNMLRIARSKIGNVRFIEGKWLK